jgi:hypothetical protein
MPRAECFVCADDGGADVFRVCKCTTVVHAACFQRLTTTVAAHRMACPVCTTPYDVQTRRVFEFQNGFGLSVVFAMVSLLACIGLGATLFVPVRVLFVRTYEGVFVLAAWIVALVASYCASFCFWRAAWRSVRVGMRVVEIATPVADAA